MARSRRRSGFHRSRQVHRSRLDAVDARFSVRQCAALLRRNGNEKLLEIGRRHTLDSMAEHLTHTGVHDHGFNNLSTYGQLRRLMLEGKIERQEWELRFYELALKVSGAVQAARWTSLPGGDGYIYSFNGPHSLFIDTIRTVRICGVAHALGHALARRAGSEGQSAGPALDSRAHHRQIQRLLWRGTR